jgi:hypothetical protein
MKPKRRGSSSRIGWFLAAVLVLAGCALNGWILLPVETLESVIQIKGNLEGNSASPLKDRQVKITLPVELVSGSPLTFEVTLLPDSSTNGLVASEINSIEGKLDLPGVDIFPAETIQTPYFSDTPVSFRWLVTAQGTSAKWGRIWLYVDRKNSLNSDPLVPVLARPIEFSVRSYLGFPGTVARWIGMVLAGYGLAIAGWMILHRKTKNE